MVKFRKKALRASPVATLPKNQQNLLDGNKIARAHELKNKVSLFL